MSRAAPARGFTLIELCMGMLVTGFIATVLAAFASAMSHQWHHSEQQQHLEVSAQQSARVLGPLVQSARAVGNVFAAPVPAVFLWQNDDLNRAGVAQFGEMTLIEYDAATDSIYVYQPDADADLAGDAMASKAITDEEMTSYTVVQLFKSQAWLKPTRVLLGPGPSDDDDYRLTHVTSCAFEAGDYDLPVVGLNATLRRGNQTLEISDRFALRAPTTQPVVTSGSVTTD